MPLLHRFALLAALVTSVWPLIVHADPKTVCTITVNSPDERETFRRNLPADQYQFVELVERGRPDWLASACRKGVRCDVLLISGHFDGGDEFYSDKVDARESLPVDEMERVSCSDSCPGLFSQLKEVYLFGCNTLNPEALRSAADELRQSLLQSGHSASDADRLARALSARYADSSRDRMRHIFRNVPAIYGFSSVAPLGPLAATYLDRYLQAGGAHDVGTGRAGSRVVGYFPGRSLTLTRGLRDGDADAASRRDVCQFVDDRLTPAQKVESVHRLLRRDMAEVRVFLDRLERCASSLDASARQAPTRTLDKNPHPRPLPTARKRERGRGQDAAASAVKRKGGPVPGTPSPMRTRLTPELHDYARRQYEHSAQPVSHIALDVGVDESVIRRMAKREEWVRYVAAPRDLPPVAKLLAQVEELEASVKVDRHPEVLGEAEPRRTHHGRACFEAGLRPAPQHEERGDCSFRPGFQA